MASNPRALKRREGMLSVAGGGRARTWLGGGVWVWWWLREGIEGGRVEERVEERVERRAEEKG